MAYSTAQRAYSSIGMRYVYTGLFYTVIAILFLFPIIPTISTNIFFGDGSHDGYQFLWNLWWVRYALETGEPFFYTDQIFAPKGTPLVLHTLSLSNGILSLPLQYFFPDYSGQIIALNLLTIGHFVFLGCMVHVLCRKLTCSHMISACAAILISYLPYRIHHLHHINLLSTGWLVASLYAWICLKENSRSWKYLTFLTISSSALIYADHEQSLSFVILSGLFCTLYAKQLSWKHIFLCGMSVICITAPLWTALFSFPPSQYLSTGAQEFSTHIPSLFVPAQNELFFQIWSNHQLESQLGWIFWVYLLFGWHSSFPLRSYFLITTLVFLTLSFGGSLNLGFIDLNLPLPYDLINNGWISLGRAPIRFLPIAILFIVIYASIGCSRLSRNKQYLLLGMVLLFRWPEVIPTERIAIPPSISILAQDTRSYAIWHIKESYKSIQKDMFWQSIHKHPISGGYTARIWEPAYQYKQSISAHSNPAIALSQNGFGVVIESGSADNIQWLITPQNTREPKE